MPTDGLTDAELEAILRERFDEVVVSSHGPPTLHVADGHHEAHCGTRGNYGRIKSPAMFPNADACEKCLGMHDDVPEVEYTSEPNRGNRPLELEAGEP